jgi:hypothetical protein
VWLVRRPTVTPGVRLALITGAAAFVLLVILGYALDLGWTGFPGNTLWDWIALLALPLALAAWPVWAQLRRGGIDTRDKVIIGTVAAAFVAVSVGAYVFNWAWAGFNDNKLWDWLSLWLVPILIPLVLLPTLEAAVEAAAEEQADTPLSDHTSA